MTLIAARCASGCAQNAIPESYGTFSHLWPSVAHESARSLPRSRWRSCGEAAAQRPKAPSTWNHAPASAAMSAIASRSSKAPVFTSPAWPQTIVGPLAEPQLVDAHPALVVHRDDLERRGADPEQTQRAVDRDVTLRADDDADRRRTGQAVLRDVPADAREHVVPRRGERGDVRHLAAGHERDRDVRGSPSSSASQRAADLLDDGRGGAAGVEAGVLVPDRGEPVGGDRRGHGAADHEAEVAAGRDADDAGRRVLDERRENRARVHALLRQRPAERADELLDVRLGRDRTLVESLEEVGCIRGRLRQELAFAHLRDSIGTSVDSETWLTKSSSFPVTEPARS